MTARASGTASGTAGPVPGAAPDTGPGAPVRDRARGPVPLAAPGHPIPLAAPGRGDEHGDEPLTILYRGPLASCDLDCPYCPFAKRRDPPEALRADREALERFVAWARTAPERLRVLFTPWGEALTRSWYREAMVTLSHLPGVERVAAQTNLSARTGWTARADRSRLALWTTYHPGQVTHERFLGRCRDLIAGGVRFSVGVVGLPEHLGAARRMRAELPREVYLWVNAAEGRVYTDAEAAQWSALDPLFGYSRLPHASAGRACRTGETVISVDGDGVVRRCHFVPAVLGRLYDGSFRAALRPRPCPRAWCDCHIGYVHMTDTGLYDVFAGGIVERVPAMYGAPPAPPNPLIPSTLRDMYGG